MVGLLCLLTSIDRYASRRLSASAELLVYFTEMQTKIVVNEEK